MEIEYTADFMEVNGRTISLEIDDEQILDCESPEEAMKMLKDEIRRDHRENVTPGYEESEIRSRVKSLFENKPKEEEVED